MGDPGAALRDVKAIQQRLLQMKTRLLERDYAAGRRSGEVLEAKRARLAAQYATLVAQATPPRGGAGFSVASPPRGGELSLFAPPEPPAAQRRVRLIACEASPPPLLIGKQGKGTRQRSVTYAPSQQRIRSASSSRGVPRSRSGGGGACTTYEVVQTQSPPARTKEQQQLEARDARERAILDSLQSIHRQLEALRPAQMASASAHPRPPAGTPLARALSEQTEEATPTPRQTPMQPHALKELPPPPPHPSTRQLMKPAAELPTAAQRDCGSEATTPPAKQAASDERDKSFALVAASANASAASGAFPIVRMPSAGNLTKAVSLPSPDALKSERTVPVPAVSADPAVADEAGAVPETAPAEEGPEAVETRVITLVAQPAGEGLGSRRGSGEGGGVVRTRSVELRVRSPPVVPEPASTPATLATSVSGKKFSITIPLEDARELRDDPVPAPAEPVEVIPPDMSEATSSPAPSPAGTDPNKGLLATLSAKPTATQVDWEAEARRALAAGEWIEKKDKGGRTFYMNKATSGTTWDLKKHLRKSSKGFIQQLEPLEGAVPVVSVSATSLDEMVATADTTVDEAAAQDAMLEAEVAQLLEAGTWKCKTDKTSGKVFYANKGDPRIPDKTVWDLKKRLRKLL